MVKYLYIKRRLVMETNTISITNNTTATPCSNTITLDKTLVATVENP